MGVAKRIPADLEEFFNYINETDDLQKMQDPYGYTRHPFGPDGRQDYRIKEGAIEIKDEPVFRRWDWTEEESKQWSEFRNEYDALYKKAKGKTSSAELKKQLEQIISDCKAYDKKHNLVENVARSIHSSTVQRESFRIMMDTLTYDTPLRTITFKCEDDLKLNKFEKDFIKKYITFHKEVLEADAQIIKTGDKIKKLHESLPALWEQIPVLKEKLDKANNSIFFPPPTMKGAFSEIVTFTVPSPEDNQRNVDDFNQHITEFQGEVNKMCNDCNEIFEDVKRFEDSMEDEEVEKPDSLFEEIKKINREFFHNNLAIDSMSVEDDYQDFLGAWDSSGNKGNIIISEAWGKFVDDQKLFISVYNAFIGFLTNSFNKNPESDESIEKQAGFPIEETDDLRAETLKKYEFDAKNNTNSYFDTMDWHIILDKYAREPDGKNKIVIMEKALAQHPDDQTLLIRSATFQVDEHKYQQALDLLKQAEKQGPPHHPNFYYVKANLYMQLQSPDQAIPLYKKLTDQKGDELKWWRTHSYDCLIDIYDEKKNYNECIVICKAMIEEQPDKDLLFSRLAYFYSQLNKHEDAVQILKSFIEKHPESSGCELQLGHTYKDMKKYEDAIIHYDNSFNIDRDENYGAIYNKGQILMELKRFDEAVVCFELCILYFKLEKDYNLAAGKCYVELKQNQLAIAHYRRALYIDRDCKEALDALLVLTKK